MEVRVGGAEVVVDPCEEEDEEGFLGVAEVFGDCEGEGDECYEELASGFGGDAAGGDGAPGFVEGVFGY